MMTPEKVRTIDSIRKTLCRRQHQFADRGEVRDPGNCDGERIVCGQCETTAHEIYDGLEREGLIR